MRRCYRNGLAALSLLFVPLLHLRAQSTKAELFGVVSDPSRRPVAGAAVVLTNTGTDSKLSAESDTNGGYHFFALPAGAYQLVIAKSGFSALRRSGIAIRVGDRLNLDLQLQIGEVFQSVVVTAAVPLLQSTCRAARFVVEQEKVG